jgi:glucose/mannose-6-phosphate isomerase
MEQLITSFPQQLSEAMEIGKQAQLSPPNFTPHHLITAGLGGSGIGGDLLNAFVGHELDFPVIPNKDYELPGYVNENSLVFISSYSGNTEETNHAYDQAVEGAGKVVAITSNGKIQEKSKKHDINHIVIPGGMPPRACLGYSVVQQLYILHHLNFIDEDFQNALSATVSLLKNKQPDIRERAQSLAQTLTNRLPIIYITNEMAPVALRYRQQFNENAKHLCWHHVIPEMNHNELVGWRQKQEHLHVLFLRNETDRQRIQQRIALNREIIESYTPHITEIYSKGNSFIERAFYLIHFGDWLSYYLARAKDVDPTEVDVIDYLKGELAQKPLEL